MGNTNSAFSDRTTKMNPAVGSPNVSLEQFASLPKLVRETLLVELLTIPSSIPFNPSGTGSEFQTQNTKIHANMSLMSDSSTNPAIAREACEVFYGRNIFTLPLHHLAYLLRDQTGTWVKDVTIRPRDLISKINLHIQTNEDEATGRLARDLSQLLTCPALKIAYIFLLVEKGSPIKFFPIIKILEIVALFKSIRPGTGLQFRIAIYRITPPKLRDGELEQPKGSKMRDLTWILDDAGIHVVKPLQQIFMEEQCQERLR